MSGPEDRVRAAGKVLGIELEVREFPEGTATAADAARAIGCDVAQIVKSLVWVAGNRGLLALVSGGNRIDPEALAALVDASQARPATPAEALDMTGFTVGGTPPFGHTTELPTVLDRTLLAFDEVWCSAGTASTVFAIGPDALVRATAAIVGDIHQGASPL